MKTATKPESKTHWVLLENFTFTDGTDVDRTVWESPQWQQYNNPDFFGQTNIRNPVDYPAPKPGYVPVINHAAQLYLSTNDPNNPNNSTFLGAQIGTIKKWGLASYNSVAFEAEVVLPISGSGAAPGGVVAALFAYNLISSSPFLHDEIDFEISSNYWQDSGEQINTNVYVVTDGSMNNFDQVVSSPTPPSLSGTVVLRIEWSEEGVKWYINKDKNPMPFYTETNVPQSDMSLVLNFWVPASGWGWAYNANLQPTAAPGTTWAYQVNWAKVWVIEKTMNVTVEANQEWQNTGLTVVPGDTISINYQSNLWTADPNTDQGKLYDAAGFSGIIVDQPGYTLLGANMGALCGFIGEQPVGDGSDNAFLVGDAYNGTSQESGQLWLCINDDLKGLYGAGLRDNIGNVIVSVTVS
ncbi:glycoside hydrolase family 16 protein [Flavobacterium sp. B17]|uniref:glycoside hydrolase family 16 protein n=1 Tax=Flavobacterium sp. B17 TaxID=95618 RepID=UPI000344BE49|nr:glycoside hydrolase family 16 protein [Flavobacterium sp. B17]